MNILPMVEDANILYFQTKGIDVVYSITILEIATLLHICQQDKIVDSIQQTNEKWRFFRLAPQII